MKYSVSISSSSHSTNQHSSHSCTLGNFLSNTNTSNAWVFGKNKRQYDGKVPPLFIATSCQRRRVSARNFPSLSCRKFLNSLYNGASELREGGIHFRMVCIMNLLFGSFWNTFGLDCIVKSWQRRGNLFTDLRYDFIFMAFCLCFIQCSVKEAIGFRPLN